MKDPLDAPKRRYSDIYIILALLLANLPSINMWFFVWQQSLNDSHGAALIWQMAANSLFWLLLDVGIIFWLVKNKRQVVFFQYFKRQPALWVFISIACLSVAWSIYPLMSAYKVWILLSSTFLGAYMGFRLNLPRLLTVIAWFGGLVIFLSIAFVELVPELGIMLHPPYTGAWEGIFWHKNQLGSIMALFNIVFLIKAIWCLRNNHLIAVLNVTLYLVSLFGIYKAGSAAGVAIAAVLNGSTLVILLWLKFHNTLTRRHYLLILGVLAVGLVVAWMNLEFVFGLLNRSSSLTGRVPMWAYLFEHVIAPNPWVGYGFGAIWAFPGFTAGLGQVIGWEFPVKIGDNGFIDILLSLGLAGIVPLLVVMACAFSHFRLMAIKQRSLNAFFPLLFLLYLVLANTSFSLLLENESFIWVLLVALLFLPRAGQEQASEREQN